MRSLGCSFTLIFIPVISTVLLAQAKTDAQMDGFAGSIRSVASAAATYGVRWQQPGGPTLVVPMWCRDCEYAPDGTKTKSGQMVDGKFFGETIRLVRDANGNLTDRYSFSSTPGELHRHDVMGPYEAENLHPWKAIRAIDVFL